MVRPVILVSLARGPSWQLAAIRIVNTHVVSVRLFVAMVTALEGLNLAEPAAWWDIRARTFFVLRNEENDKTLLFRDHKWLH